MAPLTGGRPITREPPIAPDIGGGPPALAPGDIGGRPLAPGTHWRTPLQEVHPDIGSARALIMFAGGDPTTGARFLQKKGFDVRQLEGFNYALRKKGEPWRVLDPSRAELADIGDIAGDILSLGGTIAGGAVGTVAGTAAGATAGGIGAVPGGVAGGVAGAAAGSGAVQLARTGIGAALGLEPTAGEVVRPAATEALLGGTAEVGGRLIGRAIGAVGGRLSRAKLRPAQTGLQAGELQALQATAGAETKAALKALGTLPKAEEFVAKFHPRAVIRTPGGNIQPGVRTMVAMKGVPESPIIRKHATAWATNLGPAGGRQALEKLGVNSAGLKTIDDVADTFYRFQTGGLKNIGLGFDPVKRQLIGPLVDAERYAAQGLLGRIPQKATPDFWRFIPLEGLKSLEIGGREYLLSNAQARGFKAMVVGLASGSWVGQSAHLLGRVLNRLSQTLRLPRTALLEFAKWTRMAFLRKFINIASGGPLRGAGTAAMLYGGGVGGPLAGVFAADVLGQGIGKVSHALMADSAGGFLKGLMPSLSGSALRRAGRALEHSAAGNQFGYKAAVFELLHLPDFRQALSQASGVERNRPGDDLGRRPVVP